MALTLSISTLISLTINSGKLIYTTLDLTKNGLDSLKSPLSKYLCDIISEVTEDLQQTKREILLTGRGVRLTQTLIHASEWAVEYDEKCTAKKIFLSSRYEKKFQKHHKLIARHFAALVVSNILTVTFKDVVSSRSEEELELNI